jgi:sigma-B regulation protein RsbU (phosphoserine phosphatase)
VAGTWQPARVVGGDYFDVLELPDHRLAICIADVVGKSVSAALLMANVQATVRAFAQDTQSPAALCRRVNEILCSNIATGKFVTFFYGILDPVTQIFEYANAGHPQPLVVDKLGMVRRAGGGGLVLGLFPGANYYEDSSIVLQPGDKLLLFTDGIAEAFSPDGEEFGEARIAASVQATLASSAQQVSDALFDEVTRFCRSQFHDDATLMVVSSASSTVQ